MSDAKRHPIKVVSRRTGLTPEVLRIWERRYGLVEPGRTHTGRRVYSDEDIERLRLVRRATLSGRRVSEVSGLSNSILEELAGEDERALRAGPVPARDSAKERPASANGSDPRAASFPREPSTAVFPAGGDEYVPLYLVDLCLEAVRDFDSARLRTTLEAALLTRGALPFLEEVAAPLLRGIGEHWQRGLLDPAHEHHAAAIVRHVASRILAWNDPEPAAPALLLATPSGQRHELGAVFAGATAQTGGWRAVYLGPDLPARDIAKAAEHTRATAVALSLIYPEDDPAVHIELKELSGHLPEGTVLFFGGAGTPSYARTIHSVGGRILEDLPSFRSALEGIRNSGDPGGPAPDGTASSSGTDRAH